MACSIFLGSVRLHKIHHYSSKSLEMTKHPCKTVSDNRWGRLIIIVRNWVTSAITSSMSNTGWLSDQFNYNDPLWAWYSRVTNETDTQKAVTIWKVSLLFIFHKMWRTSSFSASPSNQATFHPIYINDFSLLKHIYTSALNNVGFYRVEWTCPETTK